MSTQKNHYIAIIGGSVAGSEAAIQLAERGFKIAVFDQMPLPYGKIEDGLPKWHSKLRDKEEALIDQKLQHPNIRFIPNCSLGKEIELDSMIDEWNFSAVLLAIGAWRDRELAIPGINQFINSRLIYQNQLIKWFNHYHEANYQGPEFDIPDNTIVIGGGLSSIDVVKIVQIVTVQKALLARGIHEDIFSLEKGIDRILDKHNLSMSQLGLKGATLVYRKTAADMPLKPFEREDQRAKAREVSEKMLNISMKRYLFNFLPNAVAIDSIVEDNDLKGIVFQKTLTKENRAIQIEGSDFEIRSPLFISSIGSLPEVIKGLPRKRDLIETSGENTCKIKGFDNIFAIGNAVTGRGNIKESRVHGRESANKIMEYHLDPKKKQFQDHLRAIEDQIDIQVNEIENRLSDKKLLTSLEINEMDLRISELQTYVGYDENYFDWKEKHLWERMEESSSSVTVKK